MSVRRSRISCRTFAMSHEMVHPAIWKVQIAIKNSNQHSKADGPLYLFSSMDYFPSEIIWWLAMASTARALAVR